MDMDDDVGGGDGDGGDGTIASSPNTLFAIVEVNDDEEGDGKRGNNYRCQIGNLSFLFFFFFWFVQMLGLDGGRFVWNTFTIVH